MPEWIFQLISLISSNSENNINLNLSIAGLIFLIVWGLVFLSIIHYGKNE